MAKVVITIEDTPKDESSVDVEFNFDKPITVDTQPTLALHLAAVMQNALKNENEENLGGTITETMHRTLN